VSEAYSTIVTWLRLARTIAGAACKAPLAAAAALGTDSWGLGLKNRS
jgi:hypothetical protein